MVIEWDAPLSTGGSPISGYTLRYELDGSGSFTDVSLGGSVYSYTITGLLPGEKYLVYVKAHTAFGDSDFTASAVEAYPGVVPVTPSAVTFTTITRNSITISWTAIAGEDTGGTIANPIALDSYNLYMTSEYGGEYYLVTSTSSTTYTVLYLNPGTMYQFKLSATNIRGESNLSSPSEMMPAVAPSSPGMPLFVHLLTP